MTDRLGGGGQSGGADRETRRRLTEFGTEVQRAIETAITGGGDRAPLEALLRKPAELGLQEEDVELELEALHGALDALTLRETLAQHGLPIVEHQHKALGDDRCHFLASAFLASDGSDRTGRLFLTDRRMLFLANPMLSLSWGSIAVILAEQRDLVVASTSRGVAYRFRCNSFSDARCAEVMAHAIKKQMSSARGYSSPPDSNATGVDGRPDSR